MRRSAAPSQIGHVSKRPRFQTPVSASSQNKDPGQHYEPASQCSRDVVSIISRKTNEKNSVRPFIPPIVLGKDCGNTRVIAPCKHVEYNGSGVSTTEDSNSATFNNTTVKTYNASPDHNPTDLLSSDKHASNGDPRSEINFNSRMSTERDYDSNATEHKHTTKNNPNVEQVNSMNTNSKRKKSFSFPGPKISGDAKHTTNANSKEDVSPDQDISPPATQNNFEIVSKKKLNFNAFKIPATSLANGSSVQSAANETKLQTQHTDGEVVTRYFSVMWCKLSKKKHKTWEGDAIMVVKDRSLTLLDMEGKEIGRGSGYKASELASLSEGNTLCIGGKEIEVMGTLSEATFNAGKCFNTAPSSSSDAPTSAMKATAPTKPFVAPNKIGECSSNVPTPSTQEIRPRYDPTAPDALVMPRPTKSQVWECNKKGRTVVDVVVDPYIGQHLRPHQRKGVVFLYKCIMGMKDYGGQGAILADEMGLGKTLQCITLIWTLLKQGPFSGKPVLKKVLIITPGSLVKNWLREFKKWLGSERLKVYAVGQDTKMEDFVHLAHHPLLIISYEMFVRTIETIRKVNFDLIVCDEGHRLKNTSIKTTTLVGSLPTRRRIVLTGTPVQNDLQELYSIVNFCNPAVLGSQSAFRRVYEEPIISSRQPEVDAEVEALGRERAAELSRITSMFILRRTSDINNKYLPPKVEVVLFCLPSELQRQLYRQLLSSPALRSCMASSDAGQHLMCISALKKLCNHPVLLHESAVKAAAAVEAEEDAAFNTNCDLYKHLLEHYPMTFDLDRPISADSGKLSVVENMLHDLHTSESSSREKIVLVSNYTQTLNVLSTLCRCKGYSFLRLDGQTPTGKRQQLVERFNSTYSPELVFLLSSKAGGVGLNLIGASRLVLFDIDWNPANDLQAMARVWRDGQRKNVYIYRLLTTGTIEEKMYQRQISKQALSGAVVDAKNNSAKLNFSPEDLRDLFTLHETTECATHSLLDCKCSGQHESKELSKSKPVKSNGIRSCQLGAPSSKSKARNLCMDELLEWKHVTGPKPDLSKVDPLLNKDSLQTVTFAFYNECNKQLIPNDIS